MPLYEYECQKCHKQFEALVNAGQKPVCEFCGSPRVEKLISTFAARSGESRPACAEHCPQFAPGGGCGCGGGCCHHGH